MSRDESARRPNQSATNQSTIVWPRVLDADTGDAFSILKSDSAEHFLTAPVPENLDRYYTDSYHGNRHGFTARFCDRRRMRIVGRAMKGRGRVRWLDVGCGDGTLLQSAAGLGWEARGVEKFPKLARARGLTVFESLADAAADGPYDVITLWHVLEHLTDPEGDLRILRSLLSPSGVLLIAVPDAACFSARWFGPHWLHWDVPRHLTHFSAPALSSFLAQQGFVARQLWQSELEYDVMGFAQSALNAWGFGHNVFFKLLTKRSIAATSGSRLWNLCLGAGLSAAALLPVALAGLLGKGGTLVFQARAESL